MPSTDWHRRWRKNSGRVYFPLASWEGAEREIDNAAALLLRAYLNGYRPDDWPTQNMGRQTIDG